MPMFSIKNRKAKPINLKSFRDEAELHKLIDDNLDRMFDIRFLRDEYITQKHGRIETLGLDESNRPVVVEYKLRKERGQLSQANRYTMWILSNKDGFQLLVEKNLGKIKGSIDFNNPKILCFAQEYDMDDRCLSVSLGFDVELYRYRYYENDTLVINKEKEPEGIITLRKGKKPTVERMKRVPREAKSIEEHLKNSPEELKVLFYDLDKKIKQISDEISQYTTNAEIIYKTSLNFAYVAVRSKKNQLRILLRTIKDRIVDSKKLTKKIPETHGYGKITRVIYISPKDLKEGKITLSDYMDIIQQSYDATQ